MPCNRRRASGLVLLVLLVAGCDQDDQQRTFADDARRVPAGFTETDNGGRVLSTDADDWRTAPLFAGRVALDPAFPNPSTAPGSSLTVSLLTFGAVSGGVQLRGIDASGNSVLLATLRETDPGTFLGPFNPLGLGAGLRRVFLFDAGGQLISYGDVHVP